MWSKRLIASLLACAALILLGGAVERDAAAQIQPGSIIAEQTPGFQDVTRLIRSPSIPVRLYSVEGPDTLMVGQEGRFGGLANIEAASLPVEIEWDFGDGSRAEGLHAVHRYDAPGMYTVRLRVANRHSVDTETLEVTVVDE